jgi:hypothetical protein
VHTWNNEISKVEVHINKLHISEDSGVLNIYVPQNRKDQELCFLQLLPAKLFNQVIMGNKFSNLTRESISEAVRIITALLLSSREAVGDLLDGAGIIPVPYPDRFDIEVYTQSLSKPAVQLEVLQANWQSTSGASPSENKDQIPVAHIFSAGPRPVYPTPPLYRNVPPSVNSQQAEYRRLLNNVIARAKRREGVFPNRGPLNLNDRTMPYRLNTSQNELLTICHSVTGMRTGLPMIAKLGQLENYI